MLAAPSTTKLPLDPIALPTLNSSVVLELPPTTSPVNEPRTVRDAVVASSRKVLLLPVTVARSAPTVTSPLSVTVAPLVRAITRLSPLPGTVAGLQLVAVLKTVPDPPLPAPTQVLSVRANDGAACNARISIIDNGVASRRPI